MSREEIASAGCAEVHAMSKKKELNPWLEMDRQSPDSGAAVTSSWDSRRSRVYLSDSEVSRL